MSEFDEIAALGFKFDICYDDEDEPITGDSEEAQLMRVAVNDASPPLPGTDVDEWLERD
jgi:hypothetical protein